MTALELRISRFTLVNPFLREISGLASWSSVKHLLRACGVNLDLNLPWLNFGEKGFAYQNRFSPKGFRRDIYQLWYDPRAVSVFSAGCHCGAMVLRAAGLCGLEWQQSCLFVILERSLRSPDSRRGGGSSQKNCEILISSPPMKSRLPAYKRVQRA